MPQLTKQKAQTLLTEDRIRGKKPTARQRRFFFFVAGGGKPTKLTRR